jgi:hypothetical protein
MNKTTIMTTLLAIEMATVLVLGLMFAFEWRGASQLNSENLTLQERLAGMQKRIGAQEREKHGGVGDGRRASVQSSIETRNNQSLTRPPIPR